MPPTITVSFNRMIEFAQAGDNYIARTKDTPTKLVYAINRVLPQARKQGQKFHEQISELLEDIQNRYCLTDPPDSDSGKILRNAQGGLEFTKAAIQKVTAEFRTGRNEARKKANIEIDPHFSTAIPEDLTDDDLDAFKGFVISDEMVREIFLGRENAPDKPTTDETAVSINHA